MRRWQGQQLDVRRKNETGLFQRRQTTACHPDLHVASPHLNGVRRLQHVHVTHTGRGRAVGWRGALLRCSRLLTWLLLPLRLCMLLLLLLLLLALLHLRHRRLALLLRGMLRLVQRLRGDGRVYGRGLLPVQLLLDLLRAVVVLRGGGLLRRGQAVGDTARWGRLRPEVMHIWPRSSKVPCFERHKNTPQKSLASIPSMASGAATERLAVSAAEQCLECRYADKQLTHGRPSALVSARTANCSRFLAGPA